MLRPYRAGLAVVAAAALALPALASPPPIPQGCAADPPPRGAAFSGPVVAVLDAGTLCVAEGPLPQERIRVRLADAIGGRDPSQLATLSLSRRVDCRAARRAGATVLGICRIDGASIGAMLRPAHSPRARRREGSEKLRSAQAQRHHQREGLHVGELASLR
jgi:hypothetical protein